MGEISITKLLVVAALIILVFGTKKLRTLGGDTGSAIKGFKKAMSDDDDSAKRPVPKRLRRRSSLIKSNSRRVSCEGGSLPTGKPRRQRGRSDSAAASFVICTDFA